jgi:hypothetical protein
MIDSVSDIELFQKGGYLLDGFFVVAEYDSFLGVSICER